MNVILEHQINHQIATLAGLLKRQTYRIIAEERLEITPEQWVILHYLWEENGLSMGDLVIKSRKDFANVTRIVENLKKQGYITKRKSRKDGRSYLVYCTKKGQEIKPGIEKCQKRSTEISLKNISKEEQATLLTILCKIENNSLDYLNESATSPK